jgi:broad specificity phosphatase PhoE
MSVLTLVRHGQAAAFEKDSDRLTSTGESQARRLAAFWLGQRVQFDEVHTGTLTRQTQTERIIAECYAAADSQWPEPVPIAGFNEYDATGVLQHLVPALAGRDARFADLVKTFEEAPQGAARGRAFQGMFEPAMQAWLDGFAPVGAEPWVEFRGRVREALRQVMDGPGNRRVIVFTSGGPIGLAVQTAMSAPERMFLEVNWRIRNTSVTDFVFSGVRLTLDCFNCLAHLDDASMRTYR